MKDSNENDVWGRVEVDHEGVDIHKVIDKYETYDSDEMRVYQFRTTHSVLNCYINYQR
jgi:primase-polymerase (primpol)-like protein